MSMQELSYTVKGLAPLLMNNPQMVDVFNPYKKKIAVLNKKGVRRTDEDYMNIRELEMRAKIYWDDTLGIYVPTRWMAAALAKVSNAQVKLSKAVIRGGVFMKGADKSKLHYAGERKVKGKEDIIMSDDFRHLMLLPQGQVRVGKMVPIFHEWSFSGDIEFDDTVIDPDTLERLILYVAAYGGFGDFRPTFGRALAEVTHA